MRSNSNTYHRLKRAIDLACASLGLVLLAPAFLIVGLLIRLESPGPAFFRQERAGKDGVPFRIFKFRTMSVAPNPIRGFQSVRDPRITRVGRWLRRFSLDELPQLINVARGEMSFIGPRPPLPYQLERYSARQRRRLDVRPGITGWAQVNGRNSLSWEEKIEFDVWYVEHCSIWLDVRILLKTTGAVIDPSGIYYHGKGSAWRAPSTE
jgi:undecaprenyl phosphate N,N'-diacetylbacillosamine 1-phosphate transferase